jgi:hypothetical protein
VELDLGKEVMNYIMSIVQIDNILIKTDSYIESAEFDDMVMKSETLILLSKSFHSIEFSLDNLFTPTNSGIQVNRIFVNYFKYKYTDKFATNSEYAVFAAETNGSNSLLVYSTKKRTSDVNQTTTLNSINQYVLYEIKLKRKVDIVLMMVNTSKRFSGDEIGLYEDVYVFYRIG